MTSDVQARASDSTPQPARPVTPLPVAAPTAVAVLLGGIQLLWFGIEQLRGYFWQDDFLLIYLAVTQPFGQLLVHNYNEHFMPGAFALIWLVTKVAPLNHAVAVLPMVLMQGLTLVLLWRSLVRLFGLRWAILVPFVMVAFAPISFVTSQWWAYALQLVPFQLALFGALHAHLGYLRAPSRWRLAAGFAWTAFGLAFLEKAALIPFVLLGVTAALGSGGLWRRLVTALGRHRLPWLGYLVLLAGYLGAHLWFVANEAAPATTAADVLRLARIMIGDSLLPGLFGGPWVVTFIGPTGLAAPPAALLGLSWVLAAAAVVAGLWLGGRRAAMAWLTLTGYLAVAVALVVVARLGYLGPVIGADPRYIADALPVAVLCGAIALLHPLPSSAEQLSAEQPPLQPVRGATVALVVAGLVVVGSVASTVQAAPQQRHEAARDYVENARAALRLGPWQVLYDAPVPSVEVMHLWFGEHAMASRVLAALRPRFDVPTADLRMLDERGIPRSIGIVETVAATPGPVPGCGYAAGQTSARVQLLQRTDGPRKVMQIGYYAAASTSATLITPHQQFAVRFERGVHYLFVVLDGPFTEFFVRAESPVCITDVFVGAPLPQPF